MPQFDPTHFSSQVFWLLVCFATLYFFSAKIILPRIQKIISERKALINQNIADSTLLRKQIDELKEKSAAIRKEASTKYQEKLDAATKQNSQDRENKIEALKTKLDTISQESSQKIKNFIANSLKEAESAVTSLTKSIKDKILS